MADRNREWFIEQLGLAAEADGFTRIAGRMFGFLLLSDAPQSLEAITETLGVSKGSVSTEARRLVQHGVLERVGVPGDRRDFYQIAPDYFTRLMEYRVARWTHFHTAVSEARRRLTHLSPAVQERLGYMDTVHDFLITSIQRSLVEWEARPDAGRDGRSTRQDDAGKPPGAQEGANERRPPGLRLRSSRLESGQ